MALQSVPWAIGNGAHNQVEGARLSLFAATGGRGGVMSPADMRVTALPVPGGAVRVHTGGAVIISGYPGASSQAYAAREESSSDVEIDATGSSGARTRYLVVRVHDHQYSGEPTPADVQGGPYNAYEWISQDPRTTSLPYPVEGLAKVTQPANTATITNDMIEDIRELAQPKRDNVIFARPRLAQDSDPRQDYVNARLKGDNGEWYGEYFPGGDGLPNTAKLFVPDYATHMSIRADWMSIVGASGKNSYGRYWVEFGDEYRNHGWPGGRQWEFATQQFAFDTTGTQGSYRMNWPLMDQVPVPKKLRGKEVTFAFKAGLNEGADTNGVHMTALSGLGLDVTFSQKPINADTL